MIIWMLRLNFAWYSVVEFCSSRFIRPGEWPNENDLPSPIVAFYSGHKNSSWQDAAHALI